MTRCLKHQITRTPEGIVEENPSSGFNLTSWSTVSCLLISPFPFPCFVKVLEKRMFWHFFCLALNKDGNVLQRKLVLSRVSGKGDNGRLCKTFPGREARAMVSVSLAEPSLGIILLSPTRSEKFLESICVMLQKTG